jgi:hypothetical protein
MAWEFDAVEQLIKSRTATDEGLIALLDDGDPLGFVFNLEAPAGHRKTCIVFSMLPGEDTPGQGRVRLRAKPRYQLKVYTLGPPDDTSEQAVNLLDDLWQKARRLTTADGLWRVASRRIAPLSGKERGAAESDLFYYRGGIFQFWISPAVLG